MTATRILVLHAGKYGQTRKIAERIAERLREAGAAVEVADVRAEPPTGIDGYDAVVIGGAVHAGNHLRPLERWMRGNAAAINARPAAVFSVSLSAAADEGSDDRVAATKLLDELLKRTGVEPAQRTEIAGAFAYRDYNPLIRWTMRRIARKKGQPTDTSQDVELTDWDAVDAFAATLADAFALRGPS